MFTSLDPGAIRLSVSFEEALRLAADNGFAALDLPVTQLRQQGAHMTAQDIKDRYAAAGLRPGGWGLPVDFRRDDETYRAGLAALPEYAALAQEIGSPWCATWILPFSDERDHEANMDFHVQRLRPVAQILADHGCRFGLEFVGPKTMRDGHRYPFIHTIDGALELGERIGTGNVGLLLDCFHWYTAHGTVDDITRLRADQVVYVHVNDAVPGRGPDEQIDNERMLPGASGVIDIAGFLGALAQIGYDGPVVVEPFNADLTALPAAERVRATAESLQRVFASQQTGR